jgi:hypothetical protein
MKYQNLHFKRYTHMVCIEQQLIQAGGMACVGWHKAVLQLVTQKYLAMKQLPTCLPVA